MERLIFLIALLIASCSEQPTADKIGPGIAGGLQKGLQQDNESLRTYRSLL